jgi:hypothetical protein
MPAIPIVWRTDMERIRGDLRAWVRHVAAHENVYYRPFYLPFESAANDMLAYLEEQLHPNSIKHASESTRESTNDITADSKPPCGSCWLNCSRYRKPFSQSRRWSATSGSSDAVKTRNNPLPVSRGRHRQQFGVLQTQLRGPSSAQPEPRGIPTVRPSSSEPDRSLRFGTIALLQ